MYLHRSWVTQCISISMSKSDSATPERACLSHVMSCLSNNQQQTDAEHQMRTTIKRLVCNVLDKMIFSVVLVPFSYILGHFNFFKEIVRKLSTLVFFELKTCK